MENTQLANCLVEMSQIKKILTGPFITLHVIKTFPSHDFGYVSFQVMHEPKPRNDNVTITPCNFVYFG